MSTKIYNGYRIRTTSIHRVMSLLKHVGAAYEADLKELVAVRLADLCTRAIDLIALKEYDVLKKTFPDCGRRPTPIWLAHGFIDRRQREIKRTMMRDPEYDFDLSITIIPTKTCFLAVVFCEQKDLSKAFIESPIVDEYAYWNNTDQPAGVSEKEWKARGKAWDAALKDTSAPGLAGLSRDFYTYLPVLGSKDVVKHVKPAFVRAKELAGYRVMNEWIRAKVNKDSPSHEVSSAVYASEKWLKTPEGQAKVLTEKTRLQEIIPIICADILKDEIDVPA